MRKKYEVGFFIEEPPFDFSMPEYLTSDIQNLITVIKENDFLHIDLYECEVIGSTNSALVCDQITLAQSQWIWWYFLEGGYMWEW